MAEPNLKRRMGEARLRGALPEGGDWISACGDHAGARVGGFGWGNVTATHQGAPGDLRRASWMFL